MFSVLIQDEKDKQKWSFLKIRKEDVKIETEEITDEETGEVKTVEKEVGLGTYTNVTYEESNPEEFEKKCAELLRTYNRSQLKFVDVKDYELDLVWDLDQNS